MSINISRVFYGCTMVALCISFFGVHAYAETLNPEGINPHAEAPRKRITQEQKQAAAEAMKKRKAEIEARKAAESGPKTTEPVQGIQPAVSDDGADNVAQ